MKENNLEKYLEHRDAMRTGDVILYESDSLLGRIIRWKTDKSHVSVIVRLPDYEGRKKRRFLLEALNHGITPTLLSKKLETYNGRAWWYPMRDEFDPVRKHIGTWAFSQIGVKYDYFDLFRSALGRVSQNMRALFCSEYAFLAALRGTEAAVRDDVSGARELFSQLWRDQRKIDFKAAWPGDFLLFTETYRNGGQIL